MQNLKIHKKYEKNILSHNNAIILTYGEISMTVLWVFFRNSIPEENNRHIKYSQITEEIFKGINLLLINRRKFRIYMF